MQGWRVGWSGLALLGFACGCAVAPVDAANLAAPSEAVDAQVIAARAEDVMRGEHTVLEAKMLVRSKKLSRERELEFERFSDRSRRRTFVSILAPETDAGTGYLEYHPNLWMYAPRVERTMRIPPSMLRKPWMKGDFTNDEIVLHTSLVESYDQRLLRIDARPDFAPELRAYVIEYTPHVESPVVWPRIVAWIEVEHGTPLRREFYDEQGELARVMDFGDIREVQGRYFPHVWVVRSMDEPDRETRIEVEELRFDAEINDSVFTTRHLMAGDQP